MDARALPFDTTVRTALAVLFGLAVAVGGSVALGWIGAPGVAAVDNDFGPVNATETTVLTDLVIHNPNPVGVRLGDTTVDYAVRMNGIRMASGTKRGVAVGTGNTTVNLTTHLHNEKIPEWWVSHVKNGENTTLVVEARIEPGFLGRTVTYSPAPERVETDVIGQFDSNETRSVNANVAAVSDPVLYVNRTSARWGDVTRAETPIEATFVLYNPKPYPVTVSRLGYDIAMNDVAVGEGETERTVTIPPHATRELTARTVIDNAKLDEWWVSHLRRNQTTRLRIDFYAVVDAGPAGQFRVPMRGLTYEHLVRTHIFQDADAAVAPGTRSATTTAGRTTTAEGATTASTTATSTTATSTTAANDTTTDDGVLGRRTSPPRVAPATPPATAARLRGPIRIRSSVGLPGAPA